MGKHRSSNKQSSAASSVQALRSAIAKILSDTWAQDNVFHLKTWLVKYMPSAGISSSGTTAWKEIRDTIGNDLKLLEKIICVFQDCRESSTILLLAQMLGELLSSKRTAKVLVQSGLTMAVLCQIRVCCCLASNSNQTPSQNQSGFQASGGEASSSTLMASLSMQCTILGSSSFNDLTGAEKQHTASASMAAIGSNNPSAVLQCSPHVAVALHQLACRIFPLDSRYNAKARATGAILGTLVAAKSLFLDRKSLSVLLSCLRFYLNSGKNLKFLGANGCLTLVHRLIASLLPRQTKLLKLSSELLSLLLKSTSNCGRFVQAGGVVTLMTTLESVTRADTRCRQLQTRRLLFRCLLLTTTIKIGRLAISSCGAISTLFQISKELPMRQDMDPLFLTALGIIRTTAGPRKLPVNTLQSPYSFDSSLSGETRSRTQTALQIRVARRSTNDSDNPAPSSQSGHSKPVVQRNPSTEDEAPPSSEDDDEEEEFEEADFLPIHHRKSLMRNDSSEEAAGPTELSAAVDDSDSDCDTTTASGGLTAANDPTINSAPLESDPIVLSSYEMFFKEIGDVTLTNNAHIPPEATTEVICNNGGGNSSGVEADFVTQVGIRVSNSGPGQGLAASSTPSCRRIAGRKVLTGKSLLSRRSTDPNFHDVPSTSSSGYVSNSLTLPDQSSTRFLPLTLIGEHIGTSSAHDKSEPKERLNNDKTNSVGGFGPRDTFRYAKLCNSNRRLAAWIKIPYPCMYGWTPINATEQQLTMPSINIRRLVLADCERFLNKSSLEFINETAYDLDALILAPSDVATSNAPLGNNDLDRIGRVPSNARNGLMFNSQFECGNLRKAIRIREFEYDLILTPDISTNHHLQWFYFEVYNTPAMQPIRFNILNCEKPKSQYEKGMQVLAFSVTEAALGRPSWRRVGWDIAYYKNYLQHPSGPLPSASYYTMTFTMQFEHCYDVVYLAYHYPYSYTALLYELECIQNRVLPADCYYTCQTLCTSEMNNNIPLITITSSQSPSSGSSSLPGIHQSSSVPAMLASLSSPNAQLSLYRSSQQQQQKPYVILTSRVHPGESNSSWMMRGLIAFLLSDTPSARRARQSFVFKIIPMLNVDGVLNGNHRCSLYGDDLNRSWTKPSSITAPSIFHAKRLMAWLRLRRKPILCFIDFHGHSRKKNVFVLGCSPAQSWRRRDVANPAIDPVTGEEDSRWRLLPVLLAATSPAFSLQDCCFMVERSKEPTGRVVCWRQVGLIATYTLEATFCGFDQGSYRGIQVTPMHLQEMGADLCRCFEPLLASMGRCPMPNATRYGEESTARGNSGLAVVGSTPASRRPSCVSVTTSSSSTSSSSESAHEDVSDDESEQPATLTRSVTASSKNSSFPTKRS